ncbi:MAG TPA: SGNH/GDSL hydrolase family protein [Oligoflexia bacterium]|nr:SGNH/GDSL hydrolase family protein [Oligoflexia bacterium]HMP26388.1 SGNH/GDSL hydrolase family protein [Oligoflexia bacterium]
MRRLFKKLNIVVFSVFLGSFWGPSPAFADRSLLKDWNGDGQVILLAFGDSITFGVGDKPNSGGYPTRLAELSGVRVINGGVPGEEFLGGGSRRLINLIRGTEADVILIMEGTNDAVRRADSGALRAEFQKIINAARYLEKPIALLKPPSPCCDHSSIIPFVDSYSDIIGYLTSINDIRVVDVKLAWETTCQDRLNCELYNLPEGLHPNSRGYDVIAQTVLAALVGIDIFVAGGAAKLESAFNLPAGTIIVKPKE